MLITSTSYPFLNLFWDILIVFAWILFIWVAIICFTDIFRRRDISGWGKAAWVVLIVIIPWIGVLAYLIFDLLPVLQSLSGAGNGDGVAHAAHLGGLAFGFAYHRFGWRIERLGASFSLLLNRRAWIRPRHVKVYRPPEEAPQSFDLKVDAILDKIHAQGEASLTDQERDVLRKASERYKSNQRHS